MADVLKRVLSMPQGRLEFRSMEKYNEEGGESVGLKLLDELRRDLRDEVSRADPVLAESAPLS